MAQLSLVPAAMSGLGYVPFCEAYVYDEVELKLAQDVGDAVFKNVHGGMLDICKDCRANGCRKTKAFAYTFLCCSRCRPHTKQMVLEMAKDQTRLVLIFFNAESLCILGIMGGRQTRASFFAIMC